MSQYTKYIARGFFTLLGALLAVVLVFIFVQYLLQQPSQTNTNVSPVPAPPTAVPTEVASEDSVINDEQMIEEVTPSGVYLRDLPLTDSQRNVAETVGIDVETYYISPETIACIESEISSERYEAIKGGDTPSIVEATKLVKCL